MCIVDSLKAERKRRKEGGKEPKLEINGNLYPLVSEAYIRKEVRKWRTRLGIWRVMQILLLLVSSQLSSSVMPSLACWARVKASLPGAPEKRFLSLFKEESLNWNQRTTDFSLSDFVLCSLLSLSKHTFCLYFLSSFIKLIREG